MSVQQFGGDVLENSFYYDEKIIVLVFGKNIQIFDSRNGKQLKVIDQLDSEILAFKVKSQTNILVVVESGKYYNVSIFENNITELGQIVQFDREQNKIFLTSTFESIYYSQNGTSIQRLSVSDKSIQQVYQSNDEKINQFFLSKEESYLVIVVNQQKVVILDTEEYRELNTVFVNKEIIRSICMNSQQNAIALGYESGRIAFFYNIFELKRQQNSYQQNSSKAQSQHTQVIQHWHAHPVTSLRFNNSNSILYSGGYEGVLVLWHQNSNQKDFLPRLSAQIKAIYVTEDDQHVITILASNQVKIIGTNNLQEKLQINGILKPHSAQQLHGFAQKANSPLVALPSQEGKIQFLNLLEEEFVKNQEIIARNIIISEKSSSPHDISHLSFSQDFKTLAVSLQRYDESCLLSQIRFYHETETLGYQLSTIIDSPHGEKVTQIISLPQKSSNSLFLTIGSDNRFRIWAEAQKNQTQAGKMVVKKFWNCLFEGGYKDQKLLQVESRLIPEQDQIVINILTDKTLAILNLDTREYQQQIEVEGAVFKFASTEDNSFIFLISENSLQIWTQGGLQKLNLPNLIDVQVKGDQLSLLLKKETGFSVLKFQIHENQLKAEDIININQPLVGIQYIHDVENSKKYLLLGLQKDNKFCLLEKERYTKQNSQGNLEQNDNLAQDPKKIQIEDEFDRLYQQFLEFSYQNELQKAADSFSAQSHILPPVRLLCNKIMDSQMIKNTN